MSRSISKLRPQRARAEGRQRHRGCSARTSAWSLVSATSSSRRSFSLPQCTPSRRHRKSRAPTRTRSLASDASCCARTRRTAGDVAPSRGRRTRDSLRSRRGTLGIRTGRQALQEVRNADPGEEDRPRRAADLLVSWLPACRAGGSDAHHEPRRSRRTLKTGHHIRAIGLRELRDLYGSSFRTSYL